MPCCKSNAALSRGNTMSAGKPVNVAASIRQRLLNKSREDKRPFNELLQYYAMERFLYRLSKSKNASNFILKGALMLRVWRSPVVRPTMDIDMLGKTNNEISNIKEQIKEIISTEVEPDGLVFDRESIKAERITEDADYKGVRIRFLASLDTARVNMQLDIGFGDIVHPKPIELNFPTLLDSQIPKLLCYSRESAIAEKFEAMIKLGELNSRMKDFYDIWLLSRQFDFDGKILSKAISLTLEHRGTVLPNGITAFSPAFIELKQVQWMAFKKRLGQEHVPENFEEIVTALKTFLMPIILALQLNTNLPKTWQASKTWN